MENKVSEALVKRVVISGYDILRSDEMAAFPWMQKPANAENQTGICIENRFRVFFQMTAM